MSYFDIAFERVIGNEGKYVNDPNDPGGETNWGISKRSYPDLDIKNLTVEDAKQIYLRDFWNRIHADDMNPALAFDAFDFAVNSGIETSVRKLQSALGVADDGYFGPVTLAALNSQPVTKTLALYIAERLEFWTKLSEWKDFGRGWAIRCVKDIRYAVTDLWTN